VNIKLDRSHEQNVCIDNLQPAFAHKTAA
jgi:hypothetical protein